MKNSLKNLVIVGCVLLLSCTTKTNKNTELKSEGHGKQIEKIVYTLQKELKDGRHDEYNVNAASPLEMVKGYLAAKYKDDKEMLESYKIVENSPKFYQDEEYAGTITPVTVIREISHLEYSDTFKKTFLKSINDLIASGAGLGFDGFEQNGCAAPTSFLLVINPEGNKVYGIDMMPCME